LRELLGHTPLEVLVGAIIGILFSVAIYRPPGGP
jgi:acid phosphatase family membrane protein YuiD